MRWNFFRNGASLFCSFKKQGTDIINNARHHLILHPPKNSFTYTPTDQIRAYYGSSFSFIESITYLIQYLLSIYFPPTQFYFFFSLLLCRSLWFSPTFFCHSYPLSLLYSYFFFSSYHRLDVFEFYDLTNNHVKHFYSCT